MVEDVTQISAAAVLGECPVWSTAEQVLYWTDIMGQKLHRFDVDADSSETIDMPGRVGSFALTARPGELLIAMEDDLHWFDWATKETDSFVTVESPTMGHRLNDGRCDPAGRFVVGTMWPDTDEGRSTGSLYKVEPDSTLKVLETDVGVPNALVFDENLGRMYWADTFTRMIWVWDYDLDTGRRTNKRIFADFADERGLPDGGCLDAEGCYWSASVYGWELIRFTPDGTVDRRVPLPVQKPSMPAFGGPNLDTLFVTTIADGSQPGKSGFDAGALLQLDPGVTGVPEPVFGATR